MKKQLGAIIASRSHYSRRAANELIKQGIVYLNGHRAVIGDKATVTDKILVEGKELPAHTLLYIAFNKPVGYECSREPQGGHPSIYELIPPKYRDLQYAGRLDVESCGLVLLSNDGQWIQEMTHPKYEIKRIYDIKLNRELQDKDKKEISAGIELEDGTSALNFEEGRGVRWRVSLKEGRKRQIRRTFKAAGYDVLLLRRISHGGVLLNNLVEGECKELADKQR